jgi:hypothetical protein
MPHCNTTTADTSASSTRANNDRLECTYRPSHDTSAAAFNKDVDEIGSADGCTHKPAEGSVKYIELINCNGTCIV